MPDELRKYVSDVSKRFDDKFWKKFVLNLETTLKRDYYPRFVEKLMENYRLLPTGPEDDPTGLEKWEETFKDHFMSKAVRNESIKVTRNKVHIGLGDRKFLGFGMEGNDESPDPIIWMVYFISDTAAKGIINRFSFISKKNYERARGEGSYKAGWGRFSYGGFMISEQEFEEEGWSSFLGAFSENEHPLSKMLSSTGPINIFELAFEEIESSRYSIFSYVDKAIEKTLREMETVGI